MIEKYIEEKFKIFDTLSSGLLSKSRREIEQMDKNNDLIGITPSMTIYARIDHIINYVFRYIE